MPFCGEGLRLPPCRRISCWAALEPGRLHHRGGGRVRLQRREGQPAGVFWRLCKKLVVNTTGVLFELLGKTGDREAITAAGDYLGDALYQLLRAAVPAGRRQRGSVRRGPSVFDGGLVAADMQLCALRYRQALAAQGDAGS